MKYNLHIFFLVFLLQLLPGGAFAQTEETAEATPQVEDSEELRDREGTQQSLMKVLKFSRERNYVGLANMMVYSGKDPNRNLRAMINYVDPHERLEVEHAANKLNYLMRKSTNYNATKFRKLSGMGFSLFYYDLECTNARGKMKVYKICFCKMNGKYLFCTIE